jgi:predicted Fe-Mo cluster-binding NifX family protein
MLREKRWLLLEALSPFEDKGGCRFFLEGADGVPKPGAFCTRVNDWKRMDAKNTPYESGLARNLLEGFAELAKYFHHGVCGKEFAISTNSPKGMIMLAIPVLRSRVAPVLNWCSRIQIFPEEPSQERLSQELHLPHLEAAQRLEVLRDQGVITLICGALSADLLRYARELGLTIVSGVAGEVEEVVESYWKNNLDHPRFWLPGCHGTSRYRSGWRGGNGAPCYAETKAGGHGRRSRSDRTRTMGLGPGGFCLCPVCSLNVPHEQGIPCIQVRCPRCGQPMERT